MVCTLDQLALRRIRELGQVALSAHEDIMRWQPKQITKETSKLSLVLQAALQEQRQWIDALLALISAADAAKEE